jgi:hypothetical protein
VVVGAAIATTWAANEISDFLLSFSKSAEDNKLKGVQDWVKTPPIYARMFTCRYLLYLPVGQCENGTPVLLLLLGEDMMEHCRAQCRLLNKKLRIRYQKGVVISIMVKCGVVGVATNLLCYRSI